MDSVDLEVLKRSASWVKQGWRVLLVTVLRTWGSSPRPEGAMLAIRADGALVGSVSGGCVEDDLIRKVQAAGVSQRLPGLVRYGVSADDAHRFGLPCGGTLELVLEPLSARSGIDVLLRELETGGTMTRMLDMQSGTVTLKPIAEGDRVSFDGRRFVTVHGPRYRMLVIGAGQLSRYLIEVAQGLDYQISLCDPREEYLSEWAGSSVRVIRSMPDDAVVEMKLDARSAVVALTHDPKLDDLALMEALKTPAFYVGAIGSRRNNAARRTRLATFDLNREQIARLRGPAGIYIGSKTPPEIALSILAEVTAAKNGIRLPRSAGVEAAKRDLEGRRGLELGERSSFADSSCNANFDERTQPNGLEA